MFFHIVKKKDVFSLTWVLTTNRQVFPFFFGTVGAQHGVFMSQHEFRQAHTPRNFLWPCDTHLIVHDTSLCQPEHI